MAIVTALYLYGRVITENSNDARLLFDQSVFGAMLSDGRVQLSSFEAAYLLESEKLVILDGRSKPVSFAEFVRKVSRGHSEFSTQYAVFSDLRSKGYVVKTALKFGADFRVYDKGVKPGEDHARWVVFPVRESKMLTWQDFAAKNRVAHSTKKHLLIAVVDDENDVSYWESRWTKP